MFLRFNLLATDEQIQRFLKFMRTIRGLISPIPEIHLRGMQDPYAEYRREITVP